MTCAVITCTFQPSPRIARSVLLVIVLLVLLVLGVKVLVVLMMSKLFESLFPGIRRFQDYNGV